MARLYIDTIEQIKGEENTVSEYGKRELQPADLTLDEVRSKYYTKLANVTNDLGPEDTKKHLYMAIKIIDSDENVYEEKQVGKYQEA